jgi:hypothetical protein
MGGEFLREASVLVLIFATLDKVIRPNLGIWGVTWRTAIILLTSGIMYFWGVRLEERNTDTAGKEENDD